MTDPVAPLLFGQREAETVRKSAVISPCRLYRYRLTRHWDRRRVALPFVMLNPSTADASIDDPTIRRCMTFARREGAGGIIVVNLFAFRATKPDALKIVPDPIGRENAAHLQEIADVSRQTKGAVVCAWGTGGGDRAAAVVTMLEDRGAHLYCLGVTKEGHPKHPLYLPSGTPLVEFRQREAARR